MGMIVTRGGSVPYSGAQGMNKCLIQSCDVIETAYARKKMQMKERRNRNVNSCSLPAHHHLFNVKLMTVSRDSAPIRVSDSIGGDCIEGQQ